MKLYTCCSKTHKEYLSQFFLPSLKRIGGFEVEVARMPQLCSSGVYRAKDWRKVGQWKSLWFRHLARTNSEPYVVADCDIQFLRPCRERLLELLGDNDLCFQYDGVGETICSGFYISSGGAGARRLFEYPFEIDFFNKYVDDKHCDQSAVNHSKHVANWEFLPSAEFWTVGNGRTTSWTPGENLEVPPNIRVHHANWCSGKTNKFTLLKLVKRKFEEQHE